MKVTEYEYDDDQGGKNGNLTTVTQHVEKSGNSNQTVKRITTFEYNWRDQRIRMRRPNEQDDVEYKYNYLGEPIEERDKPRQYERVSLRDVRGRVYQVVHRYIPKHGEEIYKTGKENARAFWFEKVWRDAAGNVVAAERNGGLSLSRTR